MTETIIDIAHAKMEASPENDAARLSFYEAVADSELYILLAGEPSAESVEPELFDIENNKYALIFDREERLATFVGRAAPYAGLPGRGLIQMIKGQGVGLALNLEVGPSAMLIPSTAVDWLADLLVKGPDQQEARLKDIIAPSTLPTNVHDALTRKLSAMNGMATCAYLAGSAFENGERGNIFVFVDADETNEASLAHAIGEMLNFSGIEAGMLDVMFVSSSDPIVKRLSAVGERFDIPERATGTASVAPGSDPGKPPILR